MTWNLGINGKAVLLLAPLVSSTCSLWFSHDQHLFLSTLIRPELRARGNALLPAFWRSFFLPGVARVVGLLAVTAWSSAGAAYLHGAQLRGAGSVWWYAGAAGAATGHLLFVPAVAPRIRDMSRGEEAEDAEGANVGAQEEWLRFNWVRMVTVDAAAWVCAAVAVLKTIEV
ncbi:hypothetical protein N3K66_006858 [Trichothecium roseum]|uniref:Uncharacterized protein n=1 Tax=Trichothecium roseum TaxID=47278 RepID=A0ACC0UY98_9HYPO|nr:hypothetical protein N3K66_006858 [Trichothecium roseum]